MFKEASSTLVDREASGNYAYTWITWTHWQIISYKIIHYFVQWRLAEVFQILERDLEVLGVTAIEDRLQVKYCFKALKSMDLKAKVDIVYFLLIADCSSGEKQTWVRYSILLIQFCEIPLSLWHFEFQLSGWRTRNDWDTKKSRNQFLDAYWWQAEYSNTDSSFLQFYFTRYS